MGKERWEMTIKEAVKLLAILKVAYPNTRKNIHKDNKVVRDGA